MVAGVVVALRAVKGSGGVEDLSVASIGSLGGVDHSVAKQVVLTIAAQQQGPGQKHLQETDTNPKKRDAHKEDDSVSFRHNFLLEIVW